MKILVTGGAGFIGSHLVDRLVEDGHKVVVIDNLSTGRLSNLQQCKKKIEFINQDISKKGKWINKLRGINTIIHLASLADIVPSIENPNGYFNSNVIGTFNILESCRKFKVKKIIYAASSSCYGIPKKYPTKEDENISCEYPYALTKKIGEDLVLHYSKVYKIKCVSLRLFNVYGLRSRTSGTYGAMFGVFLKQKLSKMPFTVVGDGSQKRDFTYVSDVVEAFIKSIHYSGKEKFFNIGSGKPTTVNFITSLLGGKKVYIPKRPGEPSITHAEIKLAKSKLQWNPRINIIEGVNLLSKNINYWKEAPLWTPRKIKKATKIWFNQLG